MSKRKHKKKKLKQYKDAGRDRRGKGPGMKQPKRTRKNSDPATPDDATLLNQHALQLKASGLSDEFVKWAGLHSADDKRIAEILNWTQPQGCEGGLVIPYYDVNGEYTGYSRVRPNVPRSIDGGKYESPIGASNRAYFPPGFEKNAKSILITEGEKKALAATQAGYTCIGIPGVWNWQVADSDPRELISDLEDLEWPGRKVYLVFDSDATDKLVIQHAESELAAVLKKKGATVCIVRIPGSKETKVGLDDFLVAHGETGPARLQQLISRARKAEPWDENKYKKVSNQSLAQDFLDCRFMHPDGPTLCFWKGTFWRWVETHYVELSFDQLKAEIGKWLVVRGINRTKNLTSEVIECLKDIVILDDHIEEPALLDRAHNEIDDVIAVENGLIAMDELLWSDTATPAPHTPLWFSASVLPYAYDPEAKCPKWKNFVYEVFEGDSERTALLQEIMGYLLTDDTSFQAIFLLKGTTRSGKGTTIKTIIKLVGPENCAALNMTTLANQFAASALIGKRVAICSDAELIPQTSRRVLELLKSISGEDAIQIDRKHKSLLTVRLKTRIVIAANLYPQFDDTENALAARLQILPFRVSFYGREDLKLESKLEAELPGIFNWAMEGLRRLKQSQRFTECRESNRELGEFKRHSAPVRAFVEERCEKGAAYSVPGQELLDEYASWCDENDVHRVCGESVFGKEMKALGVQKSRPATNGNRSRVYTGIRLRASRPMNGTSSTYRNADPGKEAGNV